MGTPIGKSAIDLGTAATGGAVGGIVVDKADQLLGLGDLGVVVFGVLVLAAMLFAYLGRKDELAAEAREGP